MAQHSQKLHTWKIIFHCCLVVYKKLRYTHPQDRLVYQYTLINLHMRSLQTPLISHCLAFDNDAVPALTQLTIYFTYTSLKRTRKSVASCCSQTQFSIWSNVEITYHTNGRYEFISCFQKCTNHTTTNITNKKTNIIAFFGCWRRRRVCLNGVFSIFMNVQ